MASNQKLSLFEATLISINIMTGVGLFINTTILSQKVGALGGLGYIIVGLLMLPLIMTLYQLLTIYPEGGFYVYGRKTLSPFVGFISAWIYFFGKLASATIGIHIFITLTQELIPAMQVVSPFVLDIGMILICLLLNTYNVRIGSTIQRYFFILKLIPITFVIIMGIFFVNPAHFSAPHLNWEQLPSAIPLVLFAILGCESACSLSSKIENPKVNASRAVLCAYGMVIVINCLYQFFFYGVLGNAFASFADYKDAFPALVHYLFYDGSIMGKYIQLLLYAAIASSAFSGAYGIIYSAMWNFYTIAQHNHVPNASFFTRLNKHQIPTRCLFLEGFICLSYLLVTQASQEISQQVAALGCTAAYTISTLALFVHYRKNRAPFMLRLIPALGFLSCALLTALCGYKLFGTGIATFIIFFSVIFIGIGLFAYTKNQSIAVQSNNDTNTEH